MTSTFSLTHSLERNLKRTTCHHRTTRARWQGGSWAYFRDLSIPQWQERVSDVPLASVFLWIWDGVSTCVRRRGERGETLGEDQCDSGMKEPKISFYFPPHPFFTLQGHCFCCICVEWVSFFSWCSLSVGAAVCKLQFFRRMFHKSSLSCSKAGKYPGFRTKQHQF